MNTENLMGGAANNSAPNVNVLVPLAEGFEEIEAIAVIDVLRRGGVKVTTASIVTNRSVVSAHGVVIVADAVLSEVIDHKWAAIILPGGAKGTKNLAAHAPLIKRLQQMRQLEGSPDGGFICAICAAPTILEKAGLLTDEHVTCYPSCAPEMARPIADVPAVADGQIITGRAPGSAITFALVILEHLMGSETADNVAMGMVI